MDFARRKTRRGIAGIVATVIMFAILFTVGTSYFIFVSSQNSSYVSSLLSATNKVQGSLAEGLSIGTLLDSSGNVEFYANNTSSVTVNMTAVLVISSTGALLSCEGVGFPAGAGCTNTTPALWRIVNPGSGSPAIDTEYLYVAGTTLTIKVLTARGNTYSATYPAPASQSTSSQAVTVNLDNLKWVQLIPQASSLVQKNYVSNCNSSSCSASYNSAVTAGNILVDAVSWPNQAPPSSAPSDTLHDSFTLGASASVTVLSSPAIVQNRYTSNCNAASCGLAFNSNVGSGDTLVYAVGWANHAAPSSPTDTRGDTFTLGASQSITVNPTSPAVVQHRFASNCQATACALAFSSSVTAGNTLVLGLGWPSTQPYPYVPITVANCQSPVQVALDGSNYNMGTSATLTATLTTAHANDVIMAIVYGQNSATGTYRTPSMSDSAGLTWTARSSLQEVANANGNSLFSQEFYAIASSTLSSDSIKLTWSSAPTTWGFLQVFGVSGANTSSPFDSNSGLPAWAATGSYASVTTSNAQDFVFGLENTDTTRAPTTGSGWTAITSGVSNSYTASEYQTVSAVQNGLSVTYSNAASDENGGWGDAIQQGTGCSTSSALAIDGSTGAGTETASTSASLTTANANDLIVVFTGTSTSTTTVSSISDTSGHSWTHRQSETGSPDVEEEEWYTVASTPLSSDSITVTWSATGDNVFAAFGVSGADIAAPFDPNSSLAAVATGTSTTPSVSVTTSNANDLIIGMLANEHTSSSNCHTESYGTGFSEFLQETSPGSSSCMLGDEEYETVSATQSGLAIPFTTSSGGSNQWAEIGDAIQAAPATATPNPFQEMVTWDPALYSSYEATNLGNVRFCADTACNTPLYSWLESCSSTCSSAGSTSTSATAWVKLTSSISSGSTLTIYMVFEATSVNFDDNYWGEAPQLSSTYAQYDNGANVFNFYDNFAGTTLSAKWQTVIYGGGTISVNNGLTISANTNTYNPILVSKSTYSPGVLDSDLSLSSEQTAQSTPTIFYATVLPATTGGDYGFKTGYRFDWAPYTSLFRSIADVSGSYAAGTTVGYTLPLSSYNIWSATWGATGSEAFSFNYVSEYVWTDSHVTYGSAYLGTAGVQGGVVNEYWIRMRAVPPNDIMPLATVGGFDSGSGVAYVPITITNNQTTATPNPFQQMITWDPATYSSYEATNLGNVRFCADSGCATTLYSWLESCSSTCSSAGSTSTSATAWVKLTSSIAANGGTLTIYMVFEATSVNFDGDYWGEAPQLSSTYAQYDNGANVFMEYFNGNTATSGFSAQTGYTVAQSTGVSGPGGATINAIHVTGYGSANPDVAFVYTTALSNTGMIVEASVSNANDGTNTGFAGFVDNAAAASVQNGIDVGDGAGTDYFQQGYDAAGTITVGANGAGTGVTTWVYASTSYSGTSASSFYSYVAPQLYSTTGGYSATENQNPISGATHLYFGTFAATNGGYRLSLYYNFARVRAYPPSNVMPTISFGSLTSSGGALPSVTDTLGDAFTLAASQSATSGTSTYESAIWYATASSSGSNTITATFSVTVAGSISIYEIAGYSTSGVMSSSGSSTAGSTSASVGSFTPSSNSFVVGNVETGSSSTKYTVGSGYTTVASGSGGCDASDASQGCDEYETGLGSATTTPFTLSASTPWAEVAASFAPMATNTYYSYIWYATAASSGADTISASFGTTVAGSVSIYEISGVTATGLLSSTGSSSTSQGATSVTSMTPTTGSVVVGNAETPSTTYTAGSGYTLSGSCSSVSGCGEYQTGVGSATTVPTSITPSSPWVEAAVAFAPVSTTYYSYIWYATAGSSGSDTITATFGASVTGSVSIYEITGYTTSGVLSSTGSSTTSSTTSGVTSYTPETDSFTVGAVESPTSVQYTAGSGFTLVGTCNPVYGCSEYNAGGGGSATTVPMTLGTSAPWVEASISFSTPFNPQSGIQVGGYPTMGVASGVSVAWEVTFTNVDPQHRAITVWPQTEMAIGSAEYDGFDTDYTQAHYFIIDGLNAGSTTVTAYTKTTGNFITLAYNVPTTLYFAATTALGSTTQAFGTNVLTPFEAYFALTGIFSDGTLFGETIPYPYGIITQANAYTTPTSGATGNTVTVSCTSPCHFTANAKAMVGWINSAGQLTQLTTFTVSSSGNIPSGVTFQVPSVAAGYYTIEVTDYINSVFMTFQHT